MNDDVQRDAACCLFQFEGELRADHVEGMFDFVLAASGETARNVLVDCRRVARFDDEALQAMADFEACLTAMGGKVMVVGLGHPTLRSVIYLEDHQGANPPIYPQMA
jgi:anti-anti-sigma regulatory factor